MKNRKKLNETATELRHEAWISEFLKRNEMPETNANIFHANIMSKMVDFDTFLKKEVRTESEINEKKKPVNAAISLYNDEMRMQRLEVLCKMSRKEAWAAYIDNQCVTGRALVESEDEGFKIVSTSKVVLQAEDFMSSVCYLEYNGLVDMACILVDNIACFEFKNVDKLSKRSMTEGYIRMRNGRGWNIDDELESQSLTKLKAQMNEICALISDGACPKMVTADVKFLKFYAIRAKGQANSGGGFELVSDREILRALVYAMYTRKHELAYSYQGIGEKPEKSALRCYTDAPLSEGANKDMGENPMAEEFNPAKIAEASAISCAKPVQSEKKTAKKSGKKSAKAEVDKK